MGISGPPLAAEPDCAGTSLIARWSADRIELCSRTRGRIAASHPLDAVLARTGTLAHEGGFRDAFLPALRGTVQGQSRIIDA